MGEGGADWNRPDKCLFPVLAEFVIPIVKPINERTALPVHWDVIDCHSTLSFCGSRDKWDIALRIRCLRHAKFLGV